jgi:hypothetical protein
LGSGSPPREWHELGIVNEAEFVVEVGACGPCASKIAPTIVTKTTTERNAFAEFLKVWTPAAEDALRQSRSGQPR